MGVTVTRMTWCVGAQRRLRARGEWQRCGRLGPGVGAGVGFRHDGSDSIRSELEELMADEVNLDRSQRWRLLLDAVAEVGRLSVAEAADRLGVSRATVRRDFAALAEQQLVTRTHGGVVATSSVAYDLPVKYRDRRASLRREQIAHTAATLVQPGTVVAFNGGLTTSATARHVAARADLAAVSGTPVVTVLTNALNIASEMVLRSHIRTVTLGGVARQHAYELTGPHAVMVLEQYWVDMLFLGVDGLCPAAGASTQHADEAGVNAAMVRRSAKVVVVAGSSKLGKRTFARICGVESVHAVVTDDGASAEQVRALQDAGVDVVLADSAVSDGSNSGSGDKA